MTDSEFIEEMATRLNLLLEGDADQTATVLAVPLTHAGYANIGHFLGQMCLPRGISSDTSPDTLQNVKFLMPVTEGGRITKFATVTGAELQERAAEAAQKAQEPPDGDKIH